MEYSLGKKEAKNIKVDYIFKLDTLENHLQECVSVIIYIPPKTLPTIMVK